MWDYRRITGAKILCEPAPDAAAVLRALRERVARDVAQAAGAEQSPEDLLQAARALLEACPAEQLVAIMLRQLMAFAGARMDASIDLTPPEPMRPAKPALPARPARPARSSWSDRSAQPANRAPSANRYGYGSSERAGAPRRAPYAQRGQGGQDGRGPRRADYARRPEAGWQREKN